MKLRIPILTLAMLAGYVCHAQTVTMTSSLLTDGSNLATGKILYSPINCSTGQPISYHQGAGGIATSAAIVTTVTAGVSSATLPDTALTVPANIGFKVTAQGANGTAIIPCVQPTANNYMCVSGACNLDSYLPSVPPLPTVSYVISVDGCQGVCTVSAGSGSGSWSSLTNGSQSGSGSSQTNTLPGSFQSLLNGGFGYASQYASTGSTNCQANNATCIADPSYSTTDKPSTTSFTASPFAWEDDRLGMKSSYYHNPGNGTTNGYLWNWPYPNWSAYAGDTLSCLFDGISANFNAGCRNINFASTRPGWNWGTNSVSGAPFEGWYTGSPAVLTSWFNSAGIEVLSEVDGYKFGVGDFIGTASSTTTHNGAVDGSSEGVKAYNGNISEDQGTYTGTCSSGCMTGSISIKTTAVLDNNSQGVGQYLIDTSNTPVQGKFTNIQSGLGGGSAITVSVSSGAVTESVAWGTVAAAVTTPLNANSPFSTSETFTIAIAGGTGGSGGQFDTTHLACWAGDYHDCAVPTAVGSVSGGNQSVTMPLRKPHHGGAYLFQGGSTGSFFEATSFTETPGSQPLRYLFDVVGAINSTTLEVGQYLRSAYGPVPIFANAYGCWDIVSGAVGVPSGSGPYLVTTVTAAWNFANCAVAPSVALTRMTGATIFFTGLSVAGLNNEPCGNVTFTGTYSGGEVFTCEIALVSVSGTDTTGGTASTGQNGFKLWNGAETLSIEDETASPPSMDGIFQLEPNNIAFATGDTIEQTHHVSSFINSEVLYLNHFDPFALTNSISATMTGSGAQGSGSLTANALVDAINGNPDSDYIGSGGLMIPPNAFEEYGPYAYGLAFSDGPAYGLPFIDIQPNASQLADVNYCFPVWEIGGGGGSNSVSDCPHSGAVNHTTYGVESFAATGGFSFSGGAINSTGAYQMNGNTFVPTTVTGYHGNASGVKVPLAVNWTNSAGATLCDDGNGNITTSGCATGGSMTWPTFSGLAAYGGSNNWVTPTYAMVTALWASGACSGLLKGDGTCVATSSFQAAGATAGGDLSGTYPNPTVAQIEGAAIPTSAPLVGTNSSKQLISVTSVPNSDLANPATTVNSQTCTLGSNCTIPLSAINPQTATYQVLAEDFSSYKTITVASGTFTITLVASGSQPPNGQYIHVVNYGSGVVTIARSGQNINGGASSLSLAAASATAPTSSAIWSDGANYFAAASSSGGGGGLSGMTAGQVGVAGSATTITGSEAINGSGAGLVSGPSSATNLDCPQYTGSAGQQQDSGQPCFVSNVWNSSGAGYMVSDGKLNIAGLSNLVTGTVATANRVLIFQFIQPVTMSLGHATIGIGATASSGNSCAVGYYSASGNKLVDSGALSTTTASVAVSSSFSEVTLYAGSIYYFAYSCSSTVPTTYEFNWQAEFDTILNAVTTKFGYGANTYNGTALPSTLGTITALSSGGSPIFAEFEY